MGGAKLDTALRLITKKGKRFKPWVVMVLLFSLNYLKAQEPCGFDLHMNKIQNDPASMYLLEEQEQKLLRVIREISSSRNGGNFSVEIPVIAHILYLNGEETPGIGNNIDGQIVIDAVAQLNTHFSGSGISFCLAKRDMQGNNLVEEGIVRVNASSVSGYASSGMTINGNEYELKNLGPQFSNFNYINIWVVNNINSSGGNGQILGFAYFPNTAFDNSLDGITIVNTHLGSNSKVLTHEMGHFLNLYHTFEGDDPGNDGIPPFVCPDLADDKGDMLELTDAHIRPESGTCLSGDNTCYTPARPLTNVIHNHMNYTSEICRTEFTSDQITRMQSAIIMLRPGLQNSLGCKPACLPTFSVDFLTPTSPPVAGNFVDFINQSQGINLTYSWMLNGVTLHDYPASANLNHMFPSSGKYTLCLRAKDALNCENEKCKEIVVYQEGLCYNPTLPQCELLLNSDLSQINLPAGPHNINGNLTTYIPWFNGNTNDLRIFDRVCNFYNATGYFRVCTFTSGGALFFSHETESILPPNMVGKTGVATSMPIDFEDGEIYEVSFDLAVLSTKSSDFEFIFGLIDGNFPNSYSGWSNFNPNNITKIKSYFKNDVIISNKETLDINESDFHSYKFYFTYNSSMSKHLYFNEATLSSDYAAFTKNIKVKKCTPCIADPYFTYQTDGNCGITLTGTNFNNAPGFYTWDIECGPVISGQMNGPITLEHTFPTAGTYEVCLTITCGENTGNQYCQTITVDGKCFNCTPIEIVGKAMKCPNGESILSNLTFEIPAGFRPCRENNICFSTSGNPATTLSYVVTSSTTNTSSETISISFALDDTYTNGNDWLVLCGPNGESRCYSFELNITECTNCITLQSPAVANCVDNNPFDNLNHFGGTFTIPEGQIPIGYLPCGSISTQAGFNPTPTANPNGSWTVPFTLNTNNNTAVSGQSTLCFTNGTDQTICITVNFSIPTPCPGPPTDCIQSWSPKPTGSCEVEGDFLKYSFNMTSPAVGLNFSNLHICDFGLQAIVAGGGHVEVVGTPTVVGNTFSFNLNIYMPCGFDQTRGPYEMRLYLCDDRNQIVCLYFLLSFPPCELECGDRGSTPRNTINHGVEVYPNPSTNSIFVDITKPKDQVCTLQILDYVGKVLYEAKTEQEHNVINTTTFPKGMNMVKVLGANNEVIGVNKFIKIE